MSINRNFWLLLIFVLSGIVVGGLLGELAKGVDFLWFLSYGQDFGTPEPFSLDIGLIKLTFGIVIRINIASIIGLLLAVFVYRKIAK